MKNKPNEKDEILRKTMVKKVNVVARMPVRTIYPALYGTYQGIMMSPANILKCLLYKAYVEEVLEDGSTLELNMQNYNTVNKPVVKKEPKLEYRNAATDPITFDQVVNKKINLPPSHFLNDIKTEVDGQAPTLVEDSKKETDFFQTVEAKYANAAPVREEMPKAEVEKTQFSSEFEKNSTKDDSETDSSDTTSTEKQ